MAEGGPRSTRIKGTVVSILSNREVVLDVGERNGVELGSRFIVLGKTAAPGVTRDDGSPLFVTFPKVVVKVVRFVEDSHSVARTFKVLKGDPGTPGLLAPTVIGTMRALQGTPATPDRTETLDVPEPETVLAQVKSESKRVHVGDEVEQTIGDEYADD